jgi:hypothetical protein
MRKLASLLLAVLLIPVFGLPSNATTEDRVFQYSPPDKGNPPGVLPEWDLLEVQFAITTEDTFQIFVPTKGRLSPEQFSSVGFLVLMIDSTRNKRTDFQIHASGELSTRFKSGRALLNAAGEQIPCESYAWITSDSKAFAWEIPRDCIRPSGELNLRVRASMDGSNNFDAVPDKGWLRFKTDYLRAAKCSAKEKDTKLNHLGKTWICNRVSGKWGWRDYGPIAARNAKWVTEKAFYQCNLGSKIGVSLEDRGKTLTLNGAFRYRFESPLFISETDYNCVRKATGMPSSVDRRIGITRALDGLQEAKWGKVTAFWNYHPDQGLNITFTQN